MAMPPILSCADPWTHPRIPSPAKWSTRYEDLLAEAQGALARREAGYPDLVTKGKLDADEAAQDISAWQSIVADWDWMIGGEGTCADDTTLTQRIAALDLAIARFFERLDRSDADMAPSEMHQLDCLAALRWHAERETSRDPTDAARFWAALGHRWRAENGKPTVAAHHRSINQSLRKAA